MNFFNILFFAFLMIFFLGVIILVHEFGHYITARLAGVRVDRFAFGLPFCGPVIFRKKLFGTEFIVHLIFFFGGYLSYPESNLNCELPIDSPMRFLNKSVFQKSIITLAGIFMNILFSFIIVLLIGVIWKTIPINQYNVNFVSFKPTANESVLKSGLKSNDVIYSVNNKRLNDIIALQQYLRVYDNATKQHRRKQNLYEINKGSNLLIFLPDIYTDNTKNTYLTVIRNDEKINLPVVMSNHDNALGINIKVKESYKNIKSFNDLISGSFECIINQFYLLFFYLKGLITGQYNITDIRGIISIIKISSEISSFDGIIRSLWILSFLSVNMAVINLMPIPVLDGGKFLIILSGNALKKPVRRKVISNVLKILFVIFNIIAYFVIINDIIAVIYGIV